MAYINFAFTLDAGSGKCVSTKIDHASRHAKLKINPNEPAITFVTSIDIYDGFIFKDI